MKLFKKIARLVKNNPEVALVIVSAVAPKAAAKIIAKAGPIIAATKAR